MILWVAAALEAFAFYILGRVHGKRAARRGAVPRHGETRAAPGTVKIINVTLPENTPEGT